MQSVKPNDEEHHIQSLWNDCQGWTGELGYHLVYLEIDVDKSANFYANLDTVFWDQTIQFSNDKPKGLSP